MNIEDLQKDFRNKTGEPTVKLNKCEVGTNPLYVVWLEKRVLTLITQCNHILTKNIIK